MQHDPPADLARQAIGAKLLQRHQHRAADTLQPVFLRGAHVDQHDIVAGISHLLRSPEFDGAILGFFGLHGLLPSLSIFAPIDCIRAPVIM